MSKKDDNKTQRVLKIDINKNDKNYMHLDELCLKAKNIYNTAMYYIKNHHLATKIISEGGVPHENSLEIMNEMHNWINNYNNEIHINNLKTINDNIEFGIEAIDLNTDDLEYNAKVKKYKDNVTNFNKGNKNKLKKPLGLLKAKRQWYGEFLDKNILDKYLKDKDCFKDINSDTASTILSKSIDVWRGYFESMSGWCKDPSKYTGKPKQPKYKDKLKGKFSFETRRCHTIEKIDENYSLLKLDKSGFKDSGIEIKVPLSENTNIVQVRLSPRETKIVLEIVYSIDKPSLIENENIASIDIGINLLATVGNNINLKPIAINGLPLKSMNKHWNKEIANYKSTLMTTNGLYTSKKLKLMNNYRNNYMNTYLHKASAKIIKWCVENDISKVVIGKNKGWKNECDIGKETQTFVQIPFAKFIDMLQYKCETVGIKSIIQEESYTSKASFIDNDYIPTYGKEKQIDKFSGNRVERGLYQSQNKLKIHADLNGAYNILRKYDKNFTYNKNYLHPIILNVG